MGFVLLLNDLPNWLSAFVVFGGAIALSVGGMVWTRRYFGEAELQLNNFLGGFQYLFISQVFAGFLTFLLYGAYQRYEQVRADIMTEVDSLESLDRLAAGFPEGTRSTLRATLRDYAEHVVAVEWPQLQNRTIDAVSTLPLGTLYYTYASVEPTSKKQQEILRYSRELIAVVQEMRAVRVQRSTGALQPLLWMATASAMLVSIIFPWVFGSANPNAVAVMGVLSVIVTVSIFFVVLKLSYPFNASSGVQPTPYVAFLSDVRGRGG